MLPVTAVQAAYHETVIHGFAESGKHGIFPNGGLLSDGKGGLYGSTAVPGPNGKGTVFRLVPPVVAGGQWALKPLFEMPAPPNQSNPMGALAIDSKGVLYGTSFYSFEKGAGVGGGSIFSLTPSPGKQSWQTTAIHEFHFGSDGSNPASPVLIGKDGVVYAAARRGGASGYGSIVALTPPAKGKTAWAETVLHAFQGGDDGATPNGGLIADSKGVLYGTTSDYRNGRPQKSYFGTVFSLVPPAGGTTSWSKTILYRFAGGEDGSAPFGLSLGRDGTLYGTSSSGNGAIFALSSPATGETAWKKTTLYSFKGTNDGAGPSGVVAGPNGTLLGAAGFSGGPNGAVNRGTIYELTPPSGAAARWTFKVLHTFKGNHDGRDPWSSLLVTSSGKIYGTTSYGGGKGCNPGFLPGGCGLIFELAPVATGSE